MVDEARLRRGQGPAAPVPSHCYKAHTSDDRWVALAGEEILRALLTQTRRPPCERHPNGPWLFF